MYPDNKLLITWSIFTCILSWCPFVFKIHKNTQNYKWKNLPLCDSCGYYLQLHAQVEDDGIVFFLPIDFQQLRKLFMGAVTKFVPALEENPKEALLCMGAAVHLVGVSIDVKIYWYCYLCSCASMFHSLYIGSRYFFQAMCSSKDFQLDDINKINIRLYNHTEMIIALKNLKAAYISK